MVMVWFGWCANIQLTLVNTFSTAEHLLPLFFQLLRDDFPDVRLNIISKLDDVNNGKFGAEKLTRRAALVLTVVQTPSYRH